jgi:hypothetical protein
MEDFKINLDESLELWFYEMDPENFESIYRGHVFFHELGHFLAFKFLEEKGFKKPEAMNVKMQNLKLLNVSGVVDSEFIEDLEFPSYAIVLVSGVLFEVLFCPEELGDIKDFVPLFWRQSSMGCDKNGVLFPTGDEARFSASLGRINIHNDLDLNDKILSAISILIEKYKKYESHLKRFYEYFTKRNLKYSHVKEYYIINEDQLELDAENKKFIHGLFEDILGVVKKELAISNL